MKTIISTFVLILLGSAVVAGVMPEDIMPEVTDMSTKSIPIDPTSEIADEPHPFIQFLTYVFLILI
ncbi:hypothetical protein N9X46_01165 [Paracoccaceae bacterium]|nr:hypothetical protein [Paracoccaceae bacterium]MDB3921335.1 hypothetical protein [Paracoccaceae bacterium]MDC0583316.1 hypothetical protein [Paracoccaceae bacterium]MDC3290616.1 hypothetical protein [bacterium]MED7677883.1 hypothetical protein [Rhodobacteraceae bacterium IMCC15231]